MCWLFFPDGRPSPHPPDYRRTRQSDRLASADGILAEQTRREGSAIERLHAHRPQVSRSPPQDEHPGPPPTHRSQRRALRNHRRETANDSGNKRESGRFSATGVVSSGGDYPRQRSAREGDGAAKTEGDEDCPEALELYDSRCDQELRGGIQGNRFLYGGHPDLQDVAAVPEDLPATSPPPPPVPPLLHHDRLRTLGPLRLRASHRLHRSIRQPPPLRHRHRRTHRDLPRRTGAHLRAMGSRQPVRRVQRRSQIRIRALPHPLQRPPFPPGLHPRYPHPPPPDGTLQHDSPHVSPLPWKASHPSRVRLSPACEKIGPSVIFL